MSTSTDLEPDVPHSTQSESVKGVDQTPKEHPLTEMIRFALIAILIVVPIRMFIAQPFIVSGASMDTTFENGQYLIVDQLSYYVREPQRGEVVIFRPPSRPDDFFIKRVIGVPGDTVLIEEDRVTVTNETYPRGLLLTEPYINEDMKQNTPRQPWVLGPDEYFVMGDNRNFSQDSRVFGTVPKGNIRGRAWLRLFPPGEIDFLPGVTTITGNVNE